WCSGLVRHIARSLISWIVVVEEQPAKGRCGAFAVLLEVGRKTDDLRSPGGVVELGVQDNETPGQPIAAPAIHADVQTGVPRIRKGRALGFFVAIGSQVGAGKLVRAKREEDKFSSLVP